MSMAIFTNMIKVRMIAFLKAAERRIEIIAKPIIARLITLMFKPTNHFD
jgi:hypothetical protein